MFDSGQKWAGFVWSGQISAFPGHTGSAFRTSASLPPKARRAYNVKGAHASRMIRITASRLGRAIGGVGERANGGLAGVEDGRFDVDNAARATETRPRAASSRWRFRWQR
jgi:hypothetical protein